VTLFFFNSVALLPFFPTVLPTTSYDQGSEELHGLLAFICIAVAVPLTHGVGGVSRYAMWSFYQPFVGGAEFVRFQAIAWQLYTVSVSLLVYKVDGRVAGFYAHRSHNACRRSW
jgi:hypothetical protein